MRREITRASDEKYVVSALLNCFVQTSRTEKFQFIKILLLKKNGIIICPKKMDAYKKSLSILML